MTIPDVATTNRQFASALRAYIRHRPDADLRDEAGFRHFWADVPFRLWNALLLPDAIGDAAVLGRVLSRTAAFMRGKTEGGLAYLCEGALAEAPQPAFAAALAENGLELSHSLLAMSADSVELARETNPELEIRRARDRRTLEDYASVIAEAWGYPLEACREEMLASPFWRREFTFVGYRNGTPCTVAAVNVDDGRLYLGVVGTLASARRNGFSTTLVRHALEAARAETGIDAMLLHASGMGAPVYERMGFRPERRLFAYRLAP